MKTVQIDLFDVLVDSHDRCVLEYSADTHCHAVGHSEKPLSHFRVPQGGGTSEREQGSVAHQQLVKIHIVLPGRELEGFKAIGKLFVSQQGGSGFLRSSADEWYSQVVCEKADAVEDDPLFTIASVQCCGVG